MIRYIFSFFIDNKKKYACEDLKNLKLVCRQWRDVTYLIDLKVITFKALLEENFPIPPNENANSHFDAFKQLGISSTKKFMKKHKITSTNRFIENLAKGFISNNKITDTFQLTEQLQHADSLLITYNDIIRQLIYIKNEDLALQCLNLLNPDSKTYLNTLLTEITYQKSFKVLDKLISMGADPLEVYEGKRSLIHIAAGVSSAVLKYYLRTEAIKKINLFYWGDTPLSHAVKLKKFKNVKLLIEHGADTSLIYKIKDIEKNIIIEKSIIEVAQYYKGENSEIVSYLEGVFSSKK